MKKLIVSLAAVLTLASLSACKQKEKETGPILKDFTMHHDDEFGGAYIDISIDAFNSLGFKFGDSVDFKFSNGVTYSDIGYYSGYYVPAGQELLVGYPGYDYIKFCINYGDDLYVDNGFDLSTTVTVTVHESAKYLTIEETLSISYSDDITKYTSEEQFANFREIKVGRMKEGLIYRGASPIDNRRKRASTVDKLLRENEIQYVVDLADTRETVDGLYAKEDFNSPYFKELDEDGCVATLGMAAAYKKEDFSNKLKNMCLNMLENDGPYYIHCLEGKDRTGYVCMVLGALCGATYNELVDDYFITYQNYYGIEKGTDKYEAIKEIHIDEMIRYVFGFNEKTKLLGATYYTSATNYLLSIGLEQEQLDSLQDKLSN